MRTLAFLLATLATLALHAEPLLLHVLHDVRERHPAPGVRQRNPPGLAKSVDGGHGWRSVALEGEADFHLVAASYATPAIYVVNHLRNAAMPSPGLYLTRNEGKSWTPATRSPCRTKSSPCPSTANGARSHAVTPLYDPQVAFITPSVPAPGWLQP